MNSSSNEQWPKQNPASPIIDAAVDELSCHNIFGYHHKKTYVWNGLVFAALIPLDEAEDEVVPTATTD